MKREREASPENFSVIPLSLTSTMLCRRSRTATITIPIDPDTGSATEYPPNAATRPRISATGRTVAAIRIPKFAHEGARTVSIPCIPAQNRGQRRQLRGAPDRRVGGLSRGSLDPSEGQEQGGTPCQEEK